MGDQLATCVCAAYDTDTRLLAISSAGHIPPFLLNKDGTGFILNMPTGVPIGLAADARETVTVQMSPGETLFFLTDGVLMSPTEDFDLGLARLAASLAEAPVALDHTPPSLEELIDVRLKALSNFRHDEAVLLAARFSDNGMRCVPRWNLLRSAAGRSLPTLGGFTAPSSHARGARADGGSRHRRRPQRLRPLATRCTPAPGAFSREGALTGAGGRARARPGGGPPGRPGTTKEERRERGSYDAGICGLGLARIRRVVAARVVLTALLEGLDLFPADGFSVPGAEHLHGLDGKPGALGCGGLDVDVGAAGFFSERGSSAVQGECLHLGGR
ncbi:PP2C family protein-serine/threonine phosphatase [Streptomyces sp. c-19]|uniref:PP2C family protein-serine/threonine phosphatase n=1 Tax=Streptomyces sp. c-19 TaxID=2789275 RepID=UPI00398153A4